MAAISGAGCADSEAVEVMPAGSSRDSNAMGAAGVHGQPLTTKQVQDSGG